MTGREKILTGALDKVCIIKDKVYGKPESNLGDIAKMWTAYLDIVANFEYALEASDVAYMMTLLKIVRATKRTETEDSLIDGCGYLSLVAESVEDYENEQEFQ